MGLLPDGRGAACRRRRLARRTNRRRRDARERRPASPAHRRDRGRGRPTCRSPPPAAAVGRAVAVADGPELPFRPDRFDLVICRHPTVTPWPGIARVLRPGGTFLSQQIGGDNVEELGEAIRGPRPPGPTRGPVANAAAAGPTGSRWSTCARRTALRVRRHRRGRLLPAARRLDRSRLHRRPLPHRAARAAPPIQADGPFVATSRRFLIEARKPRSGRESFATRGKPSGEQGRDGEEPHEWRYDVATTREIRPGRRIDLGARWSASSASIGERGWWSRLQAGRRNASTVKPSMRCGARPGTCSTIRARRSTRSMPTTSQPRSIRRPGRISCVVAMSYLHSCASSRHDLVRRSASAVREQLAAVYSGLRAWIKNRRDVATNGPSAWMR